MLAFLASPSAAWGDDRVDAQPVLFFGLARTSCGEYLQAIEGEKKARPSNANPDAIYTSHYGGYLDFTDGFLIGANFADASSRRMIGQGSDHAGRMAWLENYCRVNPLGTFLVALFKLRENLAGQGR
jgi:hypothetical protein